MKQPYEGLLQHQLTLVKQTSNNLVLIYGHQQCLRPLFNRALLKFHNLFVLSVFLKPDALPSLPQIPVPPSTSSTFSHVFKSQKVQLAFVKYGPTSASFLLHFIFFELKIIVVISQIQTQILGVDGKDAYHLTTTTALIESAFI